MLPQEFTTELREYISKNMTSSDETEQLQQGTAQTVGADSFVRLFFKLYDQKIASGEIVFSRIGISKGEFTTMCGDSSYIPSKATAVKLCFTLLLNIMESEDLLKSAGYELRYDDESDLIARYFLENGIRSYEGFEEACREITTKRTTLCYIQSDGMYLMLHRIKKENDVNYGKWIGIGGKIELGETPEACLVREVREETGLALSECLFRGIVYFRSDTDDNEDMYLYTSSRFEGSLREDCPEGVLEWVHESDIENLDIWEGDRIFLEKLRSDDGFFRLTLMYSGQKLLGWHFED